MLRKCIVSMAIIVLSVGLCLSVVGPSDSSTFINFEATGPLSEVAAFQFDIDTDLSPGITAADFIPNFPAGWINFSIGTNINAFDSQGTASLPTGLVGSFASNVLLDNWVLGDQDAVTLVEGIVYEVLLSEGADYIYTITPTNPETPTPPDTPDEPPDQPPQDQEVPDEPTDDTTDSTDQTPQPPESAPQAPELHVSLLSILCNLSWAPVNGATGYVLYYAPYPYTGPECINTLDMGKITSMTAKLWKGAAFYVAVTAYNEKGESNFSNVELFEVKSGFLDILSVLMYLLLSGP